MRDYHIEQLTVFIENRPGELAAITGLLEKENISLLSIMLSDSSEFALLRLLTLETKRAKKILLDRGFIAQSSTVFGVKIEDRVGSFHHVVKTLQEKNINIRYTYIVNEKGAGIFIFKIDDDRFSEALLALQDEDITLVNQSQL